MICSKCKKELSDDLIFCPICGNELHNNNENSNNEIENKNEMTTQTDNSNVEINNNMDSNNIDNIQNENSENPIIYLIIYIVCIICSFFFWRMGFLIAALITIITAKINCPNSKLVLVLFAISVALAILYFGSIIMIIAICYGFATSGVG